MDRTEKKNKRNKLIFILSMAVTLVVIVSLVVGAFMFGNTDETEDSYTTMYPTIIKPPETDPSQNDGTTTFPYEGETFRILCKYDASRPLGDISGSAENVVSSASYERNLKLCAKYGVEMIFLYSENIYSAIELSQKSGSEPVADVVNVNMSADANSFMMKGGAVNIFDLGIDFDKSTYDRAFIDYFTFGDRCSFLLGSADPSRYLSEYVLAVDSSLAIKDELAELASGSNYSLDTLMSTLNAAELTLSLTQNTINALICDRPLFGVENGEPIVRAEDYIESYSKLLEYNTSLDLGEESSEKNIFITTRGSLPDGYTEIPLPGINRKTYVDMSSLYAFLIPANINTERKQMTTELIDSMYDLSEGIYEKIFNEKSDITHARIFDLYGVFGWGDYSSHAYDALKRASSSEKLSETLAAPTTVSVQALKILLERYNNMLISQTERRKLCVLFMKTENENISIARKKAKSRANACNVPHIRTDMPSLFISVAENAQLMPIPNHMN